MNLSNFFIRSVFSLVSLLFFSAISISLMPNLPYWTSFSVGAIGGLSFAGLLFAVSHYLKSISIRNLNVVALGLLFGWFFGFALDQMFNAVVGLIPQSLSYETITLIKSCIYLTSCYLGVTLTVQSANELCFSIPFVKFTSVENKRKDVLLDPSLLTDPRLFDIARSGLLDQQLIVSNCSLEDLRNQIESGDESTKSRAQGGLEVFKKLQALPGLDLRIIDKDFPECKDGNTKLIRLARNVGANILSAEIGKLQQFDLAESKIININLLSTALKPLASAGENIQIKIQRFGKEPRQGVGYLDDGTMVVVNGGAEYIGKTIKVVVLSIKPTSSGRMIFCNTQDIPSDLDIISEHDTPHCESGANSYYHA